MSASRRRRRAVHVQPLVVPSIFQLEPVERRLLLVGSISGTIFSDHNSDGVQNAGEPGLAGWTVFLDSNDNNVPDGGEQTRVTDASGSYEFANLFAPATYNVREVLKPGYTQTIPGSGGVILGRPGAGDPLGDAGDQSGGDDNTVDNSNRPFTRTEIVVAFKGTRGRQALLDATARDRNLRRLVDTARSSEMFHVQGTTLVEVKLPAGVDPKLVVQRFEALPNVAWAQPNYLYDDFDPREFTPNDPQYGSQYHHPLMQQNLAWDTHLGSAEIRIGITDDGVQTTHPDLVDNIWVNPGEVPNNGIDDDGNGYIDDVNGWDVWNNDNNPNPSTTGFDHGTHVAGIAAARTNNGVGVAGISNSSIVPIRFYNGSGWTSTIVANAYRYAADAPVHIVNTSYNVDQFSNDNIFAAGLQYMYDGGVMHFNSAGNNGQLNPPRQKWDQSLFVVNTTSADVRSSSSNYGWGVDLTSPGTSILSTAIGTGFASTYELKSGTSMAAPGAAGVAALIWSLHPDWTREQVAAQLIGTTDNISAQNPGIANLIGSGRANSFRALTEQLAAPRFKLVTNLPAEGAFVTIKPTSFSIDVANVFDGDTVNLSNFEMRGAGVDGEFNTSDDILVPMTLGFGVTNTQVYMIGTNRLNFTVPGQMTPGVYRFSALPGLTDPFGQAIDGNGDGTGGDAFTRTFTLLPLSNKYTVNLGDGQAVTNAHFGNHDIVGPRALSSALAFATSPHGIQVQFNEDVSASLSLADLALHNLTTNSPVDTSGYTFSYDANTNTATWNVNGILPDARFRATLAAADVADLSGNALDGNGDGTSGDDLVFQFLFMLGDADNNGRVNLDDFNIVAANFGQSGTDFTRGDFNYDGTTNLDDFNILASRFGNALAGPSTSGSTGGSTFGGTDTFGDADDRDDQLDELV